MFGKLMVIGKLIVHKKCARADREQSPHSCLQQEGMPVRIKGKVCSVFDTVNYIDAK